MKTMNGRKVPMKLVLLAMKLMSWAQQPETLKSDAEVLICGSKFSYRTHKCAYFNTKLNSTQKEDEIEEYLRKKYADESMVKRHFGDGGEEMSDEITQQTLLPGIK